MSTSSKLICHFYQASVFFCREWAATYANGTFAQTESRGIEVFQAGTKQKENSTEQKENGNKWEEDSTEGEEDATGQEEPTEAEEDGFEEVV